jgi:hypothetical protein
MNTFEDLYRFPQAYNSICNLPEFSVVLSFMVCLIGCDIFLQIRYLTTGFDILKLRARTVLAYEDFQLILNTLEKIVIIKGVIRQIPAAYKNLLHVLPVCENRDLVTSRVIFHGH